VSRRVAAAAAENSGATVSVADLSLRCDGVAESVRTFVCVRVRVCEWECVEDVDECGKGGANAGGRGASLAPNSRSPTLHGRPASMLAST